MEFKKTNWNRSVFNIKKEKHPFHLVTRSPWPFMTSLSMFSFALALTLYFHKFKGSLFALHLAVLALAIFAIGWWEDVIEESTFEGHHTKKVVKGLKLGMILFIVSELMLFFSFFWAFFHASLSPSPWFGGVWPPLDIEPIDAWGLPFSNTLLLLYSGLTVTWSHKALIAGDLKGTIQGLVLTLLAGVVFLGIQFVEYRDSPFSINDSVFGCCFYSITGLHGLHVLAGALFLAVGLVRILLRHFTRRTHFGYEAAIWYWHFVDVVWILVFLFVYWWGGA